MGSRNRNSKKASSSTTPWWQPWQKKAGKSHECVAMLLVNAYSSCNDSLCAMCSTLPSLPATWKYSENILLFHSKSRTEKWKWLSVTWRRQTVSARAFYSVRFICASNRYLLYFFDNEYFRSYWRNKGRASTHPDQRIWLDQLLG